MNQTIINTEKGFFVAEKQVFVHPKCSELVGTIERVASVDSNCAYDWEVEDAEGFMDWHYAGHKDEAIKDLKQDLENLYNGSTQAHRAEQQAYADAERSATTINN